MSGRHGSVYLAGVPERDPPFSGYWDNGQPPDLLEAGPGWFCAAEAVEWGRARALVVLIRLWPCRYLSAGVRPPDGDALPA